MNKTIETYLKAFMRKWIILALSGLLCAAIMVIEKKCFTPPVPVTGKMIFTEVVNFKRNYTNPHYNVTLKPDNIKYNVCMMSNNFKLVDYLSKRFDLEKANSNWSSMKIKEKSDWLNRHFRFDYVGNEVYEFVMEFTPEDPKDSEYLKENGANILHSYMEFANMVSNDIFGEAQVNVLDRFQYFEEHENAVQENIILKYAVIGFVLGIILASALVSVFTFKKLHDKT